jgi:competence protein ComEA
MNERRVIQFAVGLTVLLCVFIVGFSIGGGSKSKALVLVSSSSAAESSAVSESSASTAPSEAVSAAESSAESAEELQPFNLNTATKEQLVALPGVGDVIAERILDYRTKVGNFMTIEELLNVDGIGEKKLEEIRPYLYLEE